MKRNPDQTPEPFGAGSPRIPSGVFVVQKHAARHLHWDLRLELDGLLRSWAIPKGPSFDPDVKRLAMKVEDHPLDYVDFEGVIPEGYGAGSMIVWDRGLWRPLEDPHEGFKNGKLLFTLEGYKLRGTWTLFATADRSGSKASQNQASEQWLLVKKPYDVWAQKGGRQVPETSVLSGLTVEELRETDARRSELKSKLEAANIPKLRVSAAELSPMLAESTRDPFDDPAWLFELKYDGFRLLAEKADKNVQLRYRSGRPATRAFPEITAALASLPYTHFVFDGEVVVFDAEGHPILNRLQKRVQLERDRDLSRARWMHPATYMIFDLISAEGFDLRNQPLTTRKDFLREILPEAGPLRYTDHIDDQGTPLFKAIRERGLEGIMAKKKQSFYQELRSSDWLKIRSEQTEAFAVMGYTTPKGSRTGFGGLHLAQPDPHHHTWRYMGRVGSGFSEKLLISLRDRFDENIIPTPVTEVSKVDKTSVWVKPDVVIEVTYLTQSDDGIIRQSRFERVRPETADQLLAAKDQLLATPSAEGEAPERSSIEVHFSNSDKIFFPDDGITKGELREYHRAVASWMMPYFRDRAIVIHRYPDGIYGKSFFQKHAPDFTPSWIRTASIWSELAGREREQFIVENVETLDFLMNLGCISIHLWTSRVQSLTRPDWLVLDLDPKDAPFRHVARLALEAKQLADELDIPIVVKTSGSTGLHLLVPLGAAYDHEQAKTLAQLLAQVLVDRNPNIATIERSLEKRKARVYIDFVQNGRGRVLAAPYTVRERPKATVSTPLEWSEISEDMDPTQWTIRTLPERLAHMSKCPLAAALGPGVNMESLLHRAASVLEG